MPLSNLIFTPGQVPDYASMGFKAASLVPDLQAKFNAGQRAAQESQLAQLKYQSEKQKADLFAAIAPELQKYQLAELQKKMQLLQGMAVPGNYNPGVPSVPVRNTPLADRNTAPRVSSTAGKGGTPNDEIEDAPAQRAPVDPNFQFGPSMMQQGGQPWWMGLPPVSDASGYSGDASGFDNTDEYPA